MYLIDRILFISNAVRPNPRGKSGCRLNSLNYSKKLFIRASFIKAASEATVIVSDKGYDPSTGAIIQAWADDHGLT
jgi:hypothetical protein